MSKSNSNRDLNNRHDKEEESLDGLVFYTKEDLFKKKYTPDGIERLAMAIMATIQHLHISQREFARICGLESKTMNKYATGRIKNPTPEILRKMAPHVFKVQFANSEGVGIIPDETFGNDWEALDVLATDQYLSPPIKGRRSTDPENN